jgi:GDSL-like Lipase/Acylhydrolase family
MPFLRPHRYSRISLAAWWLTISVTAALMTYRAFVTRAQSPTVLEQHLSSIQATFQASDANPFAIIGDSLTADAPEQVVCGKKVVRIAFGGAQIAHARQHLMPILAKNPPAGLILAIGINDAQRRISKSRRQLIADVDADYRQLLRQAKELTPHVAVILNPPVGKDQPMGDDFFDPNLIIAVNDVIRTAANDANVPAFALAALAQPNGSAHADFTLDGVHLSPAGYAIWSGVVLDAWQASGAPGTCASK